MKTAGFKACNLPYPKYWKHYYGVLERQQDMQPGVAWFMEPIWERFSVSWLENKMEMMICFRAVWFIPMFFCFGGSVHNNVFQRPKCHPFQALGWVDIGGDIPIMIWVSILSRCHWWNLKPTSMTGSMCKTNGCIHFKILKIKNLTNRKSSAKSVPIRILQGSNSANIW